MGALEHLAEGVRGAGGGARRTAASCSSVPRTDDETPFALAAREGEGLVVVIGDDQYQMDLSWP